MLGALAAAPIVTAEDEALNQLLEDHPVADARTMSAQRMVATSFGRHGTELLPDGLLLMYGGSAGMGFCSFTSGSSENSPMIEHLVPVYTRQRSLTWRKLLKANC
jgi:hypothetical protein